MADEVERLITAPFREIVEKGTIAVENSKDAAEDVGRAMLKAAQGLIKEGDRALKKMEPLCETHLADYGTNFVIAIKESEDISQFRYDLENLLWEFDDYIETDGFEASKFEELQGASRNAAPRILHILKRMRLTAPEPSSRPVSDIASRSGGARSVAASDNLPIGLIIGSPSPMPLESPVHVEARPEIFFGAVAGPDEGLEGSPVTRPSEVSGGSLTTGHGFPAPMNGPPAGPPPPPPSTNPWDLGKAPITTSDVQYPLEVLPHRRAPVSESPILHAVGSRGNLLDSFSTTRLDDTANQPGEEEDEQRLRAASQSIAAPSEASRSPDTLSQRWTNSTQGSYEPSSPLRYDSYPFNDFSRVSRTISNGTEHSYVSAQPYGQRMSFASSEAGPLAGPPLPGPNRASALVPDSHSGTMSPTSPFQQDPNKGEYRFRQNSTDSVNSSVLDVLDFPNSPTHTLRYGPRKSSLPASMNHGYPPTAATRASLPAGPVLYEDMYVGSPRGSDTRSTAHASSSTISHSAGLEVVRYPSSVEEKILVESDEYTSGFNRAMPIRQFDCSIGPHSSFYRLKGFCKGAEDMMKGNVNTFKKTKRPVGGFAMSIVGKCPSCHFELDWKRVENDLQGDEMGNYVASGIGYRVRALQKCHLASKSIEESLFACPFCIQLGKTMEESDSTVFMSQKDFLVHLSRHPRPLPMVSGLTVIEDEEIPPEQRYSFDLHFFSPTVQSVMTGIIPEIARLPTAIATETKKAIFGMSRNTPDRAPVLQFATGARIVGIEFPEKYNGRWAIGWHDGTRGAFETDAVQIDAPPKDEVRMRGDSSLQAVAKWRWNQKSDDKWLKFDKGEVIKNISWVYDDHWCWSGQNSKGSAGILPASHIDRHSLKSIQPGDSASSGSEKKRTHLFGLSRTSDRKFGSFGSSSNRSPASRINIY